MPYVSYADRSAMSDQPLSASWGAAPLQTAALDAPPNVQPSMAPPSFAQLSQHTELESTQPAQQQPHFAQSHHSASPLPQEGGQSHITASTPAVGDSNHQLDSHTYSPQSGRQEPVAQSATDSISQTADGDHARTEAVSDHLTSLNIAPVSTEADQSMSQNLPDLSKPPRPASSLAGQHGLAKTGNVGQQPSGVGMLHDRSGMLGLLQQRHALLVPSHSNCSATMHLDPTMMLSHCSNASELCICAVSIDSVIGVLCISARFTCVLWSWQ